ncbi:laccase, partial [Mycena vulgaris]
HGLPQPYTSFYDGAPGISQCPVPPGATLLYTFTLGGWAGTTSWHKPPFRDGLFGSLVVHSAGERVASSSKYDAD